MQKLILISATCAVLTACGGGGGNNAADNTSTEPAVALSAANYEAAAKEIGSTISDFQSTTSFAQALLPGAEVSNSLSSPIMLLQAKLPEVVKLLKQKGQLTGAVTTASVSCTVGGTLEVSVDDRNNNDEFDAGDSASLTLNDCQESQSASSSGKMNFSINSGIIGTLGSSSLDISVSLQGYTIKFDGFTGVSDGSFRMKIAESGNQTVNLDVETPAMKNQYTQAGKTKVFQLKDYVVNSSASNSTTAWAVNGQVSVPTLGSNTGTIKTITRFSFNSSSALVATAGQLEVQVRDGGKMRLSATGTSNARVELDLNSDGIYEQSKLIPWADLL